MTQKEILKYNHRCAEFIKEMKYIKWSENSKFHKVDTSKLIAPPWTLEFTFLVNSNEINTELRYGINLNELKFHSNWNWIMQVKNKIISLKAIDEFNVYYDNVEQGAYVTVLPAFKNSFKTICTKVCETEKEAVVSANNLFLIWYNKNNKKISFNNK